MVFTFCRSCVILLPDTRGTNNMVPESCTTTYSQRTRRVRLPTGIINPVQEHICSFYFQIRRRCASERFANDVAPWRESRFRRRHFRWEFMWRLYWYFTRFGTYTLMQTVYYINTVGMNVILVVCAIVYSWLWSMHIRLVFMQSRAVHFWYNRNTGHNWPDQKLYHLKRLRCSRVWSGQLWPVFLP